MAKPRIIIEKLNLMGYTPETQVWLLRNGGGGQEAFEYMQLLAKDPDVELYSDARGGTAYGVRGDDMARTFAREILNRQFSVEWNHGK